MKYIKLFEQFEENIHTDEYPWDNIDGYSERERFVLLLKEFSKPKSYQLNMAWVRELLKDIDINFNNIRTHWNYNFWQDWAGTFDRDFFNVGTNLLMTACKMGHLEAVRELLKNPDIEVNVENDDDWTALMFGVIEGHLEIVKELLKHPDINPNIDNDNDNFTALHLACKKKNVEIVKELLKHPKTDLNAVDDFGNPPIYYAFMKNSYDIILAMLEYTGYLSIVTTSGVITLKNGETILEYAINKKNIEILKGLLKYPEIVQIFNTENKDGLTPLMLTCKLNQLEFVNELVKHPKIDLNYHNDQGFVALHYASSMDAIECAKILTNAGADVSIKNDDWLTPLNLAKSEGMKAILQKKL